MAIENRELWLAEVFEVEGGYVNDPEDPGGPTNMGITLETLKGFRKDDDVDVEDVVQLTKEEASAIYLVKYWQAVKGDQLPSGIDMYTADFAVNSGLKNAARELQELVNASPDMFIGPDTLAAVRKLDPLQLLIAYHARRMRFLLGRKKWPKYGRGWTTRCNDMFAMAQRKVQANPGMAEAAGSSIQKMAAVSALPTTAGLAWVYDKIGPQVFEWLKAPENIDRLQSGVVYVGSHATIMHVIIVQSGLLVMSLIGYLVISWRRRRMYTKGKV